MLKSSWEFTEDLDTLKKFCDKITIERLSEARGMQLSGFSLPYYYGCAICMTQNHFTGEYLLLARKECSKTLIMRPPQPNLSPFPKFVVKICWHMAQNILPLLQQSKSMQKYFL